MPASSSSRDCLDGWALLEHIVEFSRARITEVVAKISVRGRSQL